VSYAVALGVAAEQRRLAGNVSLMPKDCHGLSLAEVTDKLVARAHSESVRLSSVLDTSAIQDKARAIHARLTHSLEVDSDVWLDEIPGKPLLGSFAARASLKSARIKALYVNAAGSLEVSPFEPIIEIFRTFSGR
jgi:hypothetical protein